MSSINVPFEENAFFKGHKKSVVCVALNPTSTRMASGGNDSLVKLWDFQGLTKAVKSFKEFYSLEHHMMRQMTYNKTGSSLLIAPGGKNCKLYDLNGEYLMQSEAGDVYVKDVTKTTGHTASVTGCVWDPEKKDFFFTCAMDGTIRTWDTTERTVGLDKDLPTKGVWRVLDARNLLSASTCGCSSMSMLPMQSVTAKNMVVGCTDGSVQVVNVTGKCNLKATNVFRNGKQGVHEGEVISILTLPHAVLEDETLFPDFPFDKKRTFFSRGMDGTIKGFDIDNKKQPLLFSLDAPTEMETSNMCMSPCGRYLLAATCEVDKSKPKEEGGRMPYKGELLAWDLQAIRDGDASCTPVSRTPLPCGGVQVMWPSAINQVFVSLTNGEVVVGWSPASSSKGVLMSIHVEPKKEEEGAMAMGEIWTEEDWEREGFREGREGDLRLKREFRQKKFARNVEAPLDSKWGSGGALTTGVTFTDFLVGSLAKGDIRAGQEDAQKALQEYALKMEAEGVESTMIGSAYKRSQPDNILDHTSFDDLDEVAKALQLKQKCPACGLKMCTCPPSLTQQKRPKMDNWD